MIHDKGIKCLLLIIHIQRNIPQTQIISSTLQFVWLVLNHTLSNDEFVLLYSNKCIIFLIKKNLDTQMC